ncbi:MAG TPA: hypothetical protein DCX78_00675 [Nitrospina sp.]|jgi:hypothetical protein|nr:VCBS repeat-containing protein [Nitrospinaceae bacterium]HAX45328.1 hypothetical protein [Nitrospina sp.]|tara:strand:- start:198 stop:1388 length:1191 start_codon:yes stop_codon:yes gene_type:complete
MKKIFLSFFIFILTGIIAGCPSPGKARKKMPPLFRINFVMETGAEPSFMISEDFNMDGKLDLVVTNSGDNTLSYFKGRGDGTFKDQIIMKTGEDPICVVAADFNNDDYLDLAVLNYRDQSINFHINSRFGNFKKTNVLLKPGKIPINMTTGDFNFDGVADLAVTMRYHKVMILLGKGKGHFQEPVAIAVRGQPTGIVTGDYDRDKIVDVAVALAGSGNTGVQILWGKGNGTFEPSDRFKGGKQPLTIANIDVDSDGYDDLVTSSNVHHAMTLIRNNKDKTFTALKDFASGSFPKYVTVADFTGDGKPDIAVSNSTDDLITVSLGRGDGTFTYPPIAHVTDEYPQGMITGDFNDDGLIDMAVTCRDKQLVNILMKRNIVDPKPDIPAQPLAKAQQTA